MRSQCLILFLRCHTFFTNFYDDDFSYRHILVQASIFYRTIVPYQNVMHTQWHRQTDSNCERKARAILLRRNSQNSSCIGWIAVQTHGTRSIATIIHIPHIFSLVGLRRTRLWTPSNKIVKNITCLNAFFGELKKSSVWYNIFIFRVGNFGCMKLRLLIS